MAGEEDRGDDSLETAKKVLGSQRRLWDITRIVEPEIQTLRRFSEEDLRDPLVQLRLLLEALMGTSAVELKLGSLFVIMIFLFGVSLTGIPLIIFGILLIFSVVGIVVVTILAVILVVAGLFQGIFLEGGRKNRYRGVLEGKTRRELQDMCREQGIPDSGNRDEVISRLSENRGSTWSTLMYLALAGLGVLAYFLLSMFQFVTITGAG